MGSPEFPQHLCAKKASYQKVIVEEEVNKLASLAATRRSKVPAAETAGYMSLINILCVDDEQNVLNAIARLLLDENYTVRGGPHWLDSFGA